MKQPGRPRFGGEPIQPFKLFVEVVQVRGFTLVLRDFYCQLYGPEFLIPIDDEIKRGTRTGRAFLGNMRDSVGGIQIKAADVRL